MTPFVERYLAGVFFSLRCFFYGVPLRPGVTTTWSIAKMKMDSVVVHWATNIICCAHQHGWSKDSFIISLIFFYEKKLSKIVNSPLTGRVMDHKKNMRRIFSLQVFNFLAFYSNNCELFSCHLAHLIDEFIHFRWIGDWNVLINVMSW